MRDYFAEEDGSFKVAFSADMRGVDFPYADLTGADLRRANFEGANLEGAVIPWDHD